MVLTLGAVFIYLKVLLTPTHIVIVMEYVAGGKLYDRIMTAKTLSEDEVCLFC